MGIPVIGALFVLEVPHAYGIEYFEAFSPAIVASMVASFVSRFVEGTMDTGRVFIHEQHHRVYEPFDVGYVIALGLIGGFVALTFSFMVRNCRRAADYLRHCSQVYGSRWLGIVMVMTLAAAVCGTLGIFYPQSMFWGEHELQSIIDFGEDSVGLVSDRLLSKNILKPPINASGFVQLLLVKMVCIAISVAAGYPGGVIFPLFIVAVTLSNTMLSFGPDQAFRSLCLMAAVEGGATRTPLSASLFALLTSYPASEASDLQMVPAVFPFVFLASYVACAVTSWYPLFPEQQQRRDISLLHPPPFSVAPTEAQSSTVDMASVDGDAPALQCISEPEFAVTPPSRNSPSTWEVRSNNVGIAKRTTESSIALGRPEHRRTSSMESTTGLLGHQSHSRISSLDLVQDFKWDGDCDI
jgi:hypothetical protein